MATITILTAWALLTPAWTRRWSATSFLSTTARTTPAASRCRSEKVKVKHQNTTTAKTNKCYKHLYFCSLLFRLWMKCLTPPGLSAASWLSSRSSSPGTSTRPGPTRDSSATLRTSTTTSPADTRWSIWSITLRLWRECLSGFWPTLWKREFCWICLANLNVSSLFSSSVSVATSESNGTFIDTLKMAVFNVSFGR